MCLLKNRTHHAVIRMQVSDIQSMKKDCESGRSDSKTPKEDNKSESSVTSRSKEGKKLGKYG